MAKIDIKSAFRLLPVHPADRHLLMMSWNNSVYIDMCIPFGLRSAPKLFNVAADLLQWIAEHNKVTPLLHYLDDFLTLGPPQSEVCHHNLATLKLLCHSLGVPLALEKLIPFHSARNVYHQLRSERKSLFRRVKYSSSCSLAAVVYILLTKDLPHRTILAACCSSPTRERISRLVAFFLSSQVPRSP